MKKLYFFSLLVLFTAGCSAIKTVRMLKSGEVHKTNYTASVKFVTQANLMLLEARLNNSPKIYHFIFDSGAPNVLDQSTAKEMGLTTSASIQGSDATKTKSELRSVMLDSLVLGGVAFCKTSAFVIDLNKQTEIGCLHIDGIIGSNLMRKAAWKIDYEKSTLSFSDNPELLGGTSGGTSFAFKGSIQGTPQIKVTVDGKEFPLLFDTGNNSDMISFDAKNAPKISGTSVVRAGHGAVSAFGAESDTTTYAKAESFTLGDWKPGAIFYSVSKSSRGLLGSGFLRRHCTSVLLDWKNSRITVWTKTPSPLKLESFGIAPMKDSTKWTVGSITFIRGANDVPVSPGDVITAIDGTPVTAMDFCDWSVKLVAYVKTHDAMRIRAVHNGLEQEFVLTKKTLLQ